MKKFFVLLVALTIFTAHSAVLLGAVFIDDGQSYTFDDATYENEMVVLDRGTNNSPGTHVDMFDNGKVYILSAFNNSTVDIYGGSIERDLEAKDNATITMHGGSVGVFLYAFKNGTIYLDGTGFQVNGQALSIGDKVSDFGTFYDHPLEYYTGTISGTLADGTILNDILFQIYNTAVYQGTADIIIIPEPYSLFLLSLGGLVLRKRKCA